MGNERKGRYVALLCHDSLIFKRLTNQELDANIENYINPAKKEKLIAGKSRLKLKKTFTVAFATGETVKNNIYLIINKLRIVIKSKAQQRKKKWGYQEAKLLGSKPGDSPI